MKTPIENVTEFILRNSTHLPIPERIKLYEDHLDLVPHDAPRQEITRLVAQLKAADQACREFSFLRDEEQI